MASTDKNTEFVAAFSEKCFAGLLRFDAAISNAERAMNVASDILKKGEK